MNKISKILTVVTMIAAMAVPTFGGDMNGTHTIGLGYSGLVNPTDTTYVNDDARFAPDAGNTTTIVIEDGYTFSSGGQTRFGEKGVEATLTVEVGGTLDMDSECIWNEDEQSVQKNRLNVDGTAYVGQLKMYGIAGDDITTVGNGTDAATLTVVEGLLGKYGDAHITINAGSTMIITAGTFKIDRDNIGYDSYIDLNGGTLKINSLYLLQGTQTAHRIIGYGDPSATVASGGVVVTAGTGPDAGYTIYTAAAPVIPGTVFIIK